MLTYSKIFDTAIPADTLSKDWIIKDAIVWAREDVEYYGMTQKEKIKTAARIMVMRYVPQLWHVIVGYQCRKFNVDTVDLDEVFD